MLGLTKRAEFLACLLRVERLETALEALRETELRLPGDLESRLERLELDHGERHVAVLNTMEKLMRQLGARERKRVEADETAGTPEGAPASSRDGRHAGRPQEHASTAHLAKRFRSY